MQHSRGCLTTPVESEGQPWGEQLTTGQPKKLEHIFSLNPTLEDRATCYFMTNHAVGITVPGHGDVNGMTVRHVFNIMDPTLAASK